MHFLPSPTPKVSIVKRYGSRMRLSAMVAERDTDGLNYIIMDRYTEWRLGLVACQIGLSRISGFFFFLRTDCLLMATECSSGWPTQKRWM